MAKAKPTKPTKPPMRTPTRAAAAAAVKAAAAADGERVVALRGEGHSFAGIAADLGLARAIDAFNEFVQAVSRKSAAERKVLKAAEGTRLDVLEKRTRARVAPEKLDHKLAAIARLRAQLAEA
jgi:hypothetical protein